MGVPVPKVHISKYELLNQSLVAVVSSSWIMVYS
jgi:hypothetical protein